MSEAVPELSAQADLPDLQADLPDLGDHGVAAVLVENRRLFLGFLTRRLSSPADAEDLLQDFCLKALSRQHQVHDANSIVDWLYAVLRSTLYDHYRKAGRRGKASQAYAQEIKTLVEGSEADDLLQSICACLHALLPLLRPDQAELVRRIDLKEEDRARVAADMGISTGTLGVRLHRARQALRKTLLTSCANCCEHGFNDCGCAPERKETAILVAVS